MEIKAATPAGIFYGIQSLKRIVSHNNFRHPEKTLAIRKCIVEDKPRFEYRGLHLDVSRNFHSKEDVTRLIDQMALYKLNKLLITLTNDEGWRIEIPGLPALTEVGGRRGHTTDELDMLHPSYGSGPHPDQDKSPGSGHYTRSDFQKILRHAHSNHIEVIPEIDFPGHSRAAILAMKARSNKLKNGELKQGESEFVLHDENDNSRYVSAQGYSDNVLCVCRTSTYSFVEKVISELNTIYNDAGLKLQKLHTGGDEVPVGSWTESPLCRDLVANDPQLASTNDLNAHFLKKLHDILSRYEISLAGWEEVTLNSDHQGHNTTSINTDFVSSGVTAYVWNSVWGWGREDMAYRLANLGCDVVMCNSMALYFDMAYNRHPAEPGLTWSGTVDTKDAYGFEPLDMFVVATNDVYGNPLDKQYLESRVRLLPDSTHNIKGLQGQVWSETIHSRAAMDYMIFPKLLGLAERSWAPQPDWARSMTENERANAFEQAWCDFANRTGQVELPLLDVLFEGIQYRISPPGISSDGASVRANIELPGLDIRYTVDGSNPTAESNLYSGPVATRGQEPVFRAFATTGRASRAARAEHHDN